MISEPTRGQYGISSLIHQSMLTFVGDGMKSIGEKEKEMCTLERATG